MQKITCNDALLENHGYAVGTHTIFNVVQCILRKGVRILRIFAHDILVLVS